MAGAVGGRAAASGRPAAVQPSRPRL